MIASADTLMDNALQLSCGPVDERDSPASRPVRRQPAWPGRQFRTAMTHSVDVIDASAFSSLDAHFVEASVVDLAPLVECREGSDHRLADSQVEVGRRCHHACGRSHRRRANLGLYSDGFQLPMDGADLVLRHDIRRMSVRAVEGADYVIFDGPGAVAGKSAVLASDDAGAKSLTVQGFDPVIWLTGD